MADGTQVYVSKLRLVQLYYYIFQMMGDMKKKYTIATSHFAEASSVEPEVFFGYFNTFMLQYTVGYFDLFHYKIIFYNF